MVTDKILTIEDTDGDSLTIEWNETNDKLLYFNTKQVDDSPGCCVAITPEDAREISSFLRTFWMNSLLDS